MFLTLNEEVFRRDETLEIDNAFKPIIEFINNVKPKQWRAIDLDKKFSKELKTIERKVEELLNAKIILRFDDSTSPNKLSYGMMIFPSMQELKGQIEDALEKKKEGFYLRECSNSLICMDLGLLNLIRENNLNERHLTAVLLHELGHKIYVRSQREEYEKTNSIDSLVITIFGLSITLASSSTLPLILPLLILAGVTGMLSYNYRNIKSYTNSEHLSDLVAVKYGYGTEIYDTLNIFYYLTKNKSFNKIKALNNLLNKLNSSKIRRDDVEKAIKNELNDPNNSELEKKLLKDALKGIKNTKY